MIISTLPKWIDKKGISISELSRRTGISRPTLTALANNTGKGIQFDTIDTLCGFFRISVSDLLLLIQPQNISLSFDGLNDVDMLASDTKVIFGEITAGKVGIPVQCILKTGENISAMIQLNQRDVGYEQEADIELLQGSNAARELIISEVTQKAESMLYDRFDKQTSRLSEEECMQYFIGDIDFYF